MPGFLFVSLQRAAASTPIWILQARRLPVLAFSQVRRRGLLFAFTTARSTDRRDSLFCGFAATATSAPS